MLPAFILLGVIISTVTAETFIMAVLGIFGTIIVQGIKKATDGKLEGNKALTVTVVVSLALAIIGAIVTGSFLDTDGTQSYTSILNGIFTVFSVATLIYKYLLSKDTPVVS